jgi:hypothetical protein
MRYASSNCRSPEAGGPRPRVRMRCQGLYKIGSSAPFLGPRALDDNDAVTGPTSARSRSCGGPAKLLPSPAEVRLIPPRRTVHGPAHLHGPMSGSTLRRGSMMRSPPATRPDSQARSCGLLPAQRRRPWTLLTRLSPPLNRGDTHDAIRSHGAGTDGIPLRTL